MNNTLMKITLKNLYDALSKRINGDIKVRYENDMDQIHVSVKSNSLNWGYRIYAYDVFVHGYDLQYLVDSIVRWYKEFILSYYFKEKEEEKEEVKTVYDVFAGEYINESEMDLNAPSEIYIIC